MSKHDDVDDLKSPNDPPEGEKCPMCGEVMAPDDHAITCALCGEEGCTAHCIPGGRGTACVDCEDDGA